MSNNLIYKDLIAFHPGSYIEDIIEDLNITQKEFAERLGVSPKTISKLVNGKESISNETANKLSKLTGVSVSTWINLQKAYDLKVIEMGNQDQDDEEAICKQIHFKYFKDNGFVVNKTYRMKEKIQELRKLLKVSSLTYLLTFKNSVSYRNTQGFSETAIINSNIMLQLAANYAKNKTEKNMTRQNS